MLIIWINGAFGSGKTQTSFELHRRAPNSVVYDPEHVGYLIRKQIPKAIRKDDFQDYPMWREYNYRMLRYLETEHDGVLIVPMTITNPQYFHEIVGRLREDGADISHFTLRASREVLLRRLRGRGEGANSWAAQQVDRCLTAFSSEVFERYIDTDHSSIEDNVDVIAHDVGLTLNPDHGGKLRKRFDRLITQIRHIRFFQ